MTRLARQEKTALRVYIELNAKQLAAIAAGVAAFVFAVLKLLGR